MSLIGKIALVTGASRGIGRAIAVALAEAGADIAVNYKENKSGADQVSSEIEKLGRRALPIRADVSSPEEVDSMIAKIESRLGEIGILINNAGVARARPIDEIGLAAFDEAINVNLRSAFLVTEAALPPMRRNGWGRLVFISSTAANVGGMIGPHYAGSKAGMIGMMHSYASQLAKEGITANAISPGLVDTDMLGPEMRAVVQRIPVGRLGRPEEVAKIAVMLAQNSYITGQAINVNGGIYPTS